MKRSSIIWVVIAVIVVIGAIVYFSGNTRTTTPPPYPRDGITQGLHHAGVKAFAVGKGLVVKHKAGNARLFRTGNNTGSRSVADNQGNADIQRALGGLVDHGLGIGAAARGQYGDFEGHDYLVKYVFRASTSAGMV